MEIKQLNERRDIEKSARLKKRYLKFEKLINELKRNKIPRVLLATLITILMILMQFQTIHWENK